MEIIKQLSKQELMLATHRLYQMFVDGMDEKEIMETLNISLEEFTQLKEKMFEFEMDKNSDTSTPQLYAEYILEQKINLKMLDEIIKGTTRKIDGDNVKVVTKDIKSRVAAIRVKSEILNNIVKRGQEFGLIMKKPEEKRVIGGMVIADLTDKDLKKELKEMMAGWEGMHSQFGDGVNIVDMKTIDVYPPLIGDGKDVDEFGDVLSAADAEQAEMDKMAEMVADRRAKRVKKHTKNSKVKRGRKVIKKRKILT